MVYPHYYSRYSPYFPVMPATAPGYQDERYRLVVTLITEAITGERNDELFYGYLINAAPTEQEKKVITSIRDDERKHRRMFRRLYTQLTGQPPAPGLGEQENFVQPGSYLEGIEQALMGELKAFEKYRTIYLNIPQQYKDAMFEIMTDEIKHASYYNWIYAKNKG